MKRYKSRTTKKHIQDNEQPLDGMNNPALSSYQKESVNELIPKISLEAETEIPLDVNRKEAEEAVKPAKQRSKIWSMFGLKDSKSTESKPSSNDFSESEDHIISHEDSEGTKIIEDMYEDLSLKEMSEEAQFDLKSSVPVVEPDPIVEPMPETKIETEPENHPIIDSQPQLNTQEIEPILEPEIKIEEPLSIAKPDSEVEFEPKTMVQIEPEIKPVFEDKSLSNPIMENEFRLATSDEKVEDVSLNTDRSFESRKVKPSLWSALSRNKSEPKVLPQINSNRDTSEEKRDTMKTSDYPDLNSVSSKEPGAIISSTMIITGNVKLETSLLLSGKVVGNVDCDDHIVVSNNGAVEGNISAQSIKLTGGNIIGNITCEGTLETDVDTVIIGDISADVIMISGKITGEIRAKESVSLSSTAVIKGDLYSAMISVEKGAFLEGKYSVSKATE